jgi:predicted transcriptional regulator
MEALWALGEATVEEVRHRLAPQRPLARTTVQTVLNRLVERGLVTRTQGEGALAYKARYREADQLAISLDERLAAASPGARRSALLHLVEGLEPDDAQELADYVEQLRRDREAGR